MKVTKEMKGLMLEKSETAINASRKPKMILDYTANINWGIVAIFCLYLLK